MWANTDVGPGPRRPPHIVLLALLVSLAVAPSALAQRRGRVPPPPPPRVENRAETRPEPTKTPIDEFERMTPEERQKALDRLPPQQRKKLEERLKKFNQLPPEQQQVLKNMYNRLNQLPPERQTTVRQAINKFSKEPADRQRAMRDELRSLAALPPQDRESTLSSKDLKSRFSGKEQQIMRQMSDLLPPDD